MKAHGTTGHGCYCSAWSRKLSHVGLCLTVTLAGLFAQACLTWRYYLLPDEQTRITVFDDHELELYASSSIYGDPGNNCCSFELVTSQVQPLQSDSTSVETLTYLHFDSLCVRFDFDSVLQCPDSTPPTPSVGSKSEGYIWGPAKRWERITIPDKCKQIEVSLVVTLVDHGTGQLLDRRVISQALFRKHDRVAGWRR